MLIHTILNALRNAITERTKSHVAIALGALLADDLVGEAIQASLKSKYEPLVKPAHYPSVVGYFLPSQIQVRELAKKVSQLTTPDEFRALLIQAALQRASAWKENRPSEPVIQALAQDCIDAIDRHFIARDDVLRSLRILQVAEETRDVVRAMHGALGIHEAAAICHDIISDTISALGSLGIAYEVLSRTASSVSLTVHDQHSIASVMYFVHATSSHVTASYIERVVASIDNQSAYAKWYFVCNDHDVSAKAYRSGNTSVMSPSELLVALGGGGSRVLVAGRSALDRLAADLSVQTVFVAPYLTPYDIRSDVRKLEDEMLINRKDAMRILQDFVDFDDRGRLIMILGNYGSGKSALCVRFAMSLLGSSSAVAVVVLLRYVTSCADLVGIVTKATQIARAANPGKKSVVILDGVDEMHTAMHPQEKKATLHEILRLPGLCDKLIVTARTTYFRGNDDIWGLARIAGEPSGMRRAALGDLEGVPREPVSMYSVCDLNTDQTAAFLDAYCRAEGIDPEFASVFMGVVDRSDPLGVYRRLVRTPLFLSVIARIAPWARPESHSIVEVLDLVIECWQKRDVAKGRSRYVVSTRDRLDFLSFAAWHMRQERKDAIGVEEFDGLVARFIGRNSSPQDLAIIGLDLQTTGMFLPVGTTLRVSHRIFQDLLVARTLAGNWTWSTPKVMPNHNEIYLLLVLVDGDADLARKGPGFDVDGLLRANGVTSPADYDMNVNLSRAGLFYGRRQENDWARVNAGSSGWRKLVNATVQSRLVDGRPAIGVRIMNTHGMHARPAHLLKEAYLAWKEKWPSGRIEVYWGGCAVDCGSIMGLMLLAVDRGGMIELLYEGVDAATTESLLAPFRPRRADDGVLEVNLE